MRKHKNDDLFVWGLRDAVIVHVDDVENGLACNCICPCCNTALVAFNNPKNMRANHFQHKSNTECKLYYETALHLIAKQIILETKSLIVPNTTFDYTSKNRFERRENKQTLIFDKVVVEKKEGNIRPDIKCYIGEKVLLIEIAVTHKVDYEKRNKIEEVNIPLLEIDLSSFDRAIQKSELEKILHGEIGNMNWIYNPKIEDRKRIARRKEEVILEFRRTNRKVHIIYGQKKNIYDCPLHEVPYVFEMTDYCPGCRYFLEEDKYEKPIKEKYPEVSKSILFCIGHVANKFDNLLQSLNIKIKD